MKDLFPEDPTLRLFSHRYSSQTFDPTAIRPVVSPSQSRAKGTAPSIEDTLSVPNSPAPRFMEATNSPKRPFFQEDFEDDSLRPRKLARGESPLKGAAGRRLDAQRRLQANGGTPGQGYMTPQSMVPPLPREVMMLLSVIPNARYYNVERFSPEKMVELLRKTTIPVPSHGQPQPSSMPLGPIAIAGGQPAGMFEQPPTYPRVQTSNAPMSYPQNPSPQTSHTPPFSQNLRGATQFHGGASSWNFQ